MKKLCIIIVFLMSSILEASMVNNESDIFDGMFELHSKTFTSSAQLSNLVGCGQNPFVLPQFNSLYGDLQYIGVEMSFIMSGPVSIFAPLIETGQSFVIKEGDVFAFFCPEFSAQFEMLPAPIKQAIPISGELTPENNAIAIDDFVWSGKYSISNLDTANALSEYVGNGFAPVGIWTGYTSIYNSVPITVSGISNLEVECDLTYYYTVPEPATLTMLALGGMLLKRRR